MKVEAAKRALAAMGMTTACVDGNHHWSDWEPTEYGDGRIRDLRICCNCGNAATRPVQTATR